MQISTNRGALGSTHPALHISHNAPYFFPKFCIPFFLHFSCILQPLQEKLKTVKTHSRSQSFDPFGRGGDRSPPLTKRIEALGTRMLKTILRKLANTLGLQRLTRNVSRSVKVFRGLNTFCLSLRSLDFPPFKRCESNLGLRI